MLTRMLTERSKLMNKLIPLLLAASIPAFAVACGDDDAASPAPSTDAGASSSSSSSSSSSGGSSSGDAQASKDIVDTAIAAGNFTLLAKALTKAELVTTLKGAGPFTVLAPDDAAFAASGIDSAAIDGLSKEALTTILTYHVIGASADSAAVSGLTSSETLAASGIGSGKMRVKITAAAGEVRIYPTVDLSNPASKVAGAPAADPGAKVKAADVKASNGIIHVLDRVLIPPANDVVATAQKYTLLDSLVTTLVSNPGGDTPTLVETLGGAGPFTVFAPTNDAFTAAGGTIAGLTPAQVRTVLLYHVVPSFATSGDVAKATASTSLPTAAPGKSLGVTPGTPPTIKDSTGTPGGLVATDVITKNGIVHVVDKVLVPTL